MERIVGPVVELIWRKVVDSFSSRVVDQTVDNALNSVKNISDFELIFENLKKNLKSLSAKAADVEEEMMNLELSGRKKRKREVKEWLEEVESIKQVVVELGSQIESEGFITRLTDGGKAAQLNERVENLVDQSRTFGELVLDVCGTSGDTFLTEGLVGQAFSENLKTILRLLESREVSSIGVYGMGGVGKSTLATHVNNRLMQQSGGGVFWVTVSQEFTVRGLQDKIARLLGVKLSHEDEAGKRAMRLHTALSEKKNSVLILDDVWENIDMKKVGCLFSMDGCRLIITTRSLEVCRRIGCQKEILVEKLDEGEAWKLFNERLGNEKELNPEVEGIAKSMVKLCGGLPLGIITVAGSMRGKRGTHRWRNAFLELQERVKGHDGMGEDEVFEVLKFSFNRLKKRNDKSNEFDLKQLCFLYCSLYPEDYKIRREGLVRKLVSEGLVSERKSRRAQVDQGHSILDELVDVCLLERCVDYMNQECVKMHDLVRSMALKICEGKYMVRSGEWSLEEIPNQEEWTHDLEKVSLMMCDRIRIIEDGTSPNCPKLSTLLLWGIYQLEVIPESFFSKLQGLCTLDLCGTDIRMLPNSASDLVSLKALVIENCNKLEYLPHLGKLKALRELNISNTAIKKAPQGLDQLLNLRFLSMDAPGLKMLPNGVLPKLRHLEHLNLPFHIQVDVHEIENLKQLEEFHGGVKNVNDFNWFIITRGVHDPCYMIQVNSNIVGTLRKNDFGCGINELVLCGFNFKDDKVLGQDIAYLTISECEGMSNCFVDDLSTRFDNPTSLKKLKIDRCRGIECILRSNGQGFQISNTLQEICLMGLYDMEAVVMQRMEIGAAASAAQPDVFSILKRLTIEECDKMRKVGLPVSGVPNLEKVKIKDCDGIEEIFEDEGRTASTVTTLPKFKELWLDGLPRVRKVGLAVSGVSNLERITILRCGELEEIFKEDEGRVGSIVTTTLPKLIELNLRELPRLKSVSKATIISNSVQGISIWKCPRLMKKLPLRMDVHVPPLPFLTYIRVEREWWESLEWDINPNHSLLLQSVLYLY